ncbi:hypothetical protein [Chryseobacterium sp. SIMBA_029]|uniref:hypothetical protein n=1 Tax=Chryseobacterium sp. SIMBA_029 TaxID=3085772 RepID=UPI00397B201C
MKKFFFLLSLFLIISIQGQEKVLLNKGEITIPIGQKIILQPKIRNNIIIGFTMVQDQKAIDSIDLMEMFKNLERDKITDNSIEMTFSEAQMMNTPLFVLITVQKTGKKMNFKAKMRLKGGSSYSSTSIMPVISNATSVEQWKDPIDSIILYDFELEPVKK